jgi:4a-hydroxytetrahydrobiopterin dehydratase
MNKLSDAEIQAELKGVPEWSELNGAIQRSLQFADFVAAMRFVNQVADAAEKDQHHPDILIRYNKVTLTLSTHDASGITAKDFSLAKQVDAMFVAAMAAPVQNSASAGKSGGKGKKGKT